ncbi:phospho-sugar mutase [Vibrio viridaestus]|uniref:Phospho-sugar mutase n=1 Tax=Vibrio viridaestus TaxID=2487322 RepID=A0A3N9TL99_9VIBR|nr:phospho-sugar mutase [Vibrio viridaestus]RQW64901.1 phospho-sugar mutase [Vibrio viridaestus]
MKQLVDRWLEKDPDPTTQAELQTLITENQVAEIKDRFSSRLAFGTAGLRGKVGAGPNRMNRLVIQETSLGLGHYLIKNVPEAKQKGVIIGFDARPDSKQFAQDSAEVLLSLGFTVYLTDDIVPTPLIAFGVKNYSTAAGIVVTASHNPPEYNGFKVYWGNGAQIIPPHDEGIAECIDAATLLPLQRIALSKANDKLVWLSKEFNQTYLDAILVNTPSISQHHKQVSVAYTAMHGVGGKFIDSIAAQINLNMFFTVAEQYQPDGLFPTVKFPNPEEPGAMDLVIKLAKENGADLACANDPDADRFAVAAKTEDDQFRMLTGDQVGILLADYILAKKDGPCWIGNTIVSSSLLGKVANSYNANYFKTLTGFKWLTNVAMGKESKDKPFVFAYEEALGYAVNSLVSDKDGLSAFAVFVSLADELKQQGRTIWDKLSDLYHQHGFYVTAQKSIALTSSDDSIGDKLRATPPTHIAGRSVVLTEDFKSLKSVDVNNNSQPLDYPTSDVLIYHLEGDCRVIVRPSGTEPKIKCYYELCYPMEPNQLYWDAQSIADEQIAMLISEHQSEISS